MRKNIIHYLFTFLLLQVIPAASVKSDASGRTVFMEVSNSIYYVDYGSGNDNNDGLSTATAWKHAPGDINAKSIPAATALLPGDTVLLKGDIIYRGQISIPASGALDHAITYQGDAWPGLEGKKAIIDGSTPVNGWTPCTPSECQGYSTNLFFAYIDAPIDPLGLNLHEYNPKNSTDEFAWQAQEPNPADFYFFDNHSSFTPVNPATFATPPKPTPGTLTRTSLTDATTFKQPSKDYWQGSNLLIWVNPNTVVTKTIKSYNPVTHTVAFDDLGPNALYPNRTQYYAIFNSVHAIDQPGEYHSVVTADNRTKIILYPRHNTDFDNRITYSIRNWGINLNASSNVTIKGFIITKHAGFNLRDGVGIGTTTHTAETNYNVTIIDNLITHNRKGGGSGYGGIYLAKTVNTIVEDNELIDNPQNAGIFFAGGANITARGNTVNRSGSTSLRLYTISKGIVDGNTIRASQGSHANGITIYIGSQDILVANNLITDSDSPVTFQDSGNLWFINNIVDAGNRSYNVNEWPDTSRGPWARGTIAFFHNTLINNNRDSALSFGRNTTAKTVGTHTYPENIYISMNNIIDGGGNVEFRSHNLYTGKAWNQLPLAKGEFVGDATYIFVAHEAYDYRLKKGSPAIDTGTDLNPFLPVSVFPSFDFTRDFGGKVRTGHDLGAYDY